MDEYDSYEVEEVGIYFFLFILCFSKCSAGRREFFFQLKIALYTSNR